VFREGFSKRIGLRVHRTFPSALATGQHVQDSEIGKNFTSKNLKECQGNESTVKGNVI
jgi:hypothetical protein